MVVDQLLADQSSLSFPEEEDESYRKRMVECFVWLVGFKVSNMVVANLLILMS